MGDFAGLADRIEYLSDNEKIRNEFGAFARDRAVKTFSEEAQKRNLVSAINSVL